MFCLARSRVRRFIHEPVAIIFSIFVQTLVWRSSSSSWRGKTNNVCILVTLEQLAEPDDRCACRRCQQVRGGGLQSDDDNNIIICWKLNGDVDSEAESPPSSPVAKRHYNSCGRVH